MAISSAFSLQSCDGLDLASRRSALALRRTATYIARASAGSDVYGQTWRWGDEAHPKYLADQPLSVLELNEEHAISSDEFERVWKAALERYRLHL